MNAAALVALYAAKGIAVQIEAGKIGLVVYASTRVDAERVARDLAGSARAKDPKARSTTASKDEDEPAATRWWSTVEFNWEKF